MHTDARGEVQILEKAFPAQIHAGPARIPCVTAGSRDFESSLSCRAQLPLRISPKFQTPGVHRARRGGLGPGHAALGGCRPRASALSRIRLTVHCWLGVEV